MVSILQCPIPQDAVDRETHHHLAAHGSRNAYPVRPLLAQLALDTQAPRDKPLVRIEDSVVAIPASLLSLSFRIISPGDFRQRPTARGVPRAISDPICCWI